MTLSFSTQVNGKPNYFIPKIWMKLPDGYVLSDYEVYYDNHVRLLGKPWDIPDNPISPKLHTIRADPSSRWKSGMDIHMVINNRTKNRFQFAPVITVMSVQEIEIKDVTSTSYPSDFSTKVSLTVSRGEWTETFTQAFTVKVDGVQLSQDKVYQLAINDGFDSVEDFFAYFDKDFKGKLIHWTDLKY